MFTLSFLKTHLESFDESDAESMKQFKGMIGESIKQGDCHSDIGDVLTDCFCEAVKLGKFKLARNIVKRAYELRFQAMNNKKIQKPMLSIYDNAKKIRKTDDYYKLMDAVHLLVGNWWDRAELIKEFDDAWFDLAYKRGRFNCNF